MPASPRFSHARGPPLEEARAHGRARVRMRVRACCLHARTHEYLFQVADDKEGHADAGAEGAVAGVDERRGRRPAIRASAKGARRHSAAGWLAAWADAGEGGAVLERVRGRVGRNNGEGIVAGNADGEVAADGVEVDGTLDAARGSTADGLVGGDLDDVHAGNAGDHAQVFDVSKPVDVGERLLRINGSGADRSQALFAP